MELNKIFFAKPNVCYYLYNKIEKGKFQCSNRVELKFGSIDTIMTDNDIVGYRFILPEKINFAKFDHHILCWKQKNQPTSTDKIVSQLIQSNLYVSTVNDDLQMVVMVNHSINHFMSL